MRLGLALPTLALALAAWCPCAWAVTTPCPPRLCAGRPCPALPPGFAGLPCAATAQLTVEIENRSGFEVTAMVDGQLADPTATCANAGMAEYPSSAIACAAGGTCTLTIAALRPGAWIHRVKVQVPASDLQQQSQRRVLAAAPAGLPVNLVHWVVYPRTFVSPVKGGELRDRLDQAAAFLAGGSATGALVTFDWTGFPGACDPQTISFGKGRTCPTNACGPADAGYCWTGSGLVLDALDVNGEPGAVILSGASLGNDDLLRISGNANVIRGLHLSGNPDATTQSDTVAFDDAASGNRLEDLLVDGAGEGDGVSGQCNSHDNLVLRADIRHANDKGVKITDGAQLVIADSCVSGNDNGGIQATRGGTVTALRNLVQLNLPGANAQDVAQNGIWARGWPLFGPTGIKTPSSVRTDANVVRFNGAQGLAATDDAIARFHNDYVANNQYAGARVLSTAPCAVLGPSVRFDGVAFVCNAATTQMGGPQLSGACSRSRLPCRIGSTDCASGETCRGTAPRGLGLGVGYGSGEFGCCDGACDGPPPFCDECAACIGACRPPAVELGAGQNAFVAQPVVAGPAGQLVADAGVPAVPANGNFWDDCTTTACTPAEVGGSVTTAPVATIASSDPPRIGAVWPHRPARGDLVRVWGTGFDALTSVGPPGCATTMPPADACDPSNTAAPGGNTVSLRLAGMTISAEVVAVTPGMLAFRMPVDCFDADGGLAVARGGTASEEWPLCGIPPDCGGAPDGTPCEPDGLACTIDACRAGACAHEPVQAGTLCRAADGECDLPETCDGINGECPDDTVAPASTVCRPAADACDPPETCTGSTATCPADVRVGACTTTSSTPATSTTTTTGTTTTTPPCADVRCVLADPCPGEAMPAAIRKKLARAIDLADDGPGGSPKKARRRLRRACALLARTATAATKLSNGRHHKLSVACATSLLSAIHDARGTLRCAGVGR